MIVAEVGTANNASALAGTSPSIRTKTNARTAAGVADVPPVATPGSSRSELRMIDRRGGSRSREWDRSGYRRS